jgi:hypothetical protein
MCGGVCRGNSPTPTFAFLLWVDGIGGARVLIQLSLFLFFGVADVG